MEISLTKQQAFELGAFFDQPSKNFISVKEARSAVSLAKSFKKVTKNYSDYFQDLAKKANAEQESYKERLQVFTRTVVDGKLPSKEEQELKSMEEYKKVAELLTGYQKQAEEFKNTEGSIKIAVALNQENIPFLKAYFERAAVQFQLWQSGQALEEMAQFIDTL